MNKDQLKETIKISNCRPNDVMKLIRIVNACANRGEIKTLELGTLEIMIKNKASSFLEESINYIKEKYNNNREYISALVLMWQRYVDCNLLPIKDACNLKKEIQGMINTSNLTDIKFRI